MERNGLIHASDLLLHHVCTKCSLDVVGDASFAFFGSSGQPKTHSIELIQISKQEKGVANELRHYLGPIGYPLVTNISLASTIS